LHRLENDFSSALKYNSEVLGPSDQNFATERYASSIKIVCYNDNFFMSLKAGYFSREARASSFEQGMLMTLIAVALGLPCALALGATHELRAGTPHQYRVPSGSTSLGQDRPTLASSTLIYQRTATKKAE
jgi:hypothetical protein